MNQKQWNGRLLPSQQFQEKKNHNNNNNNNRKKVEKEYSKTESHGHNRRFFLFEDESGRDEKKNFYQQPLTKSFLIGKNVFLYKFWFTSWHKIYGFFFSNLLFISFLFKGMRDLYLLLTFSLSLSLSFSHNLLCEPDIKHPNANVAVVVADVETY